MTKEEKTKALIDELKRETQRLGMTSDHRNAIAYLTDGTVPTFGTYGDLLNAVIYDFDLTCKDYGITEDA